MGSKKNYWKQEFIPLPGVEGKEFYVGDILDLSSEAFKCDSFPTTFSWYMGSANEILINREDNADYKEIDEGKFVFLKNLESYVWCEMTNPALLKDTFRTVSFNVVFPTAIEFTTTNTDNIVIEIDVDTTKGGKDFKIDWGSGQKSYSISSGYPFIDGKIEGTPVNRTVKIYGDNINKIVLDNCKIDSLVINNESIDSISCKNNNLTALDLSKCPFLKYLDCSNNQIENLYLNEHYSLNSVICKSNALDSLILDSIPNVSYLDCSKNKIKTLRVDMDSSDYINCSHNNLTFSSFPVFVDEDGNHIPIIDDYDDQAPMIIPDLIDRSVAVDTVSKKSDIVNLSSEYEISKVKSKYSWQCAYYDTVKNNEIIDTLISDPKTGDYSFLDGGYFEFSSLKKIKDSVYCIITNSVYPNVKIQTEKINVCDAFVKLSIEDGCSPYSVSNFIDTTNAVSLIWHLGNHKYETTQGNIPEYTYYNKTGKDSTVTVRLEAISSTGCRAITTASFTLKHQPSVVFTVDEILPYANVPYTFTDISQYNKEDTVSILWLVDTLAEVKDRPSLEYSFKEPRDYSISLVSELSNGCADTAIKPVTIEDKQNFTIQIDGKLINEKTICSGNSVNLEVVGNHLSNFDKFKWYKDGFEYGDDTSKQITVEEKGEYYVKIIKGEEYDTISNTITINVEDKPSDKPNIKTIYDTICSNTFYIFNLEENDITGWENCTWYKDSLFYSDTTFTLSTNTEGDYFAVISKGVCRDTTWHIDLSVNDAPSKPHITINNESGFCTGDSVILTAPKQNGVIYNWKDNKGDLIHEGDTFKYKVETSNNNKIEYSLIAYKNGCKSEISKKIVYEYYMPAKPLLDYNDKVTNEGNKNIVCGNETVSIWPSIKNQAEYIWERNGIEQPSDKGTLQVDSSGTYVCKAVNEICINYSDPIEFQFVELPEVTVDDENIQDNYCNGESGTITITLSKQADDVNYIWSVGDTKYTSSSNYIKVDKGGVYTAEVLYEGCTLKTDLNREVTFHEVPEKAKFSKTDIDLCEGNSKVLTPTKIPKDSYTRIWFKNKDILRENIDSIKITESGTYVYKLTDPNTECASESDPIKVTVKKSPKKPTLQIDQKEFCSNIEVFATYSIDASSSYTLEINNESSNEEQRLEYSDTSFPVKTSGQYFIKGKHESGCFSYSDTINVLINKTPEIYPNFSSDSMKRCYGETIILSLNGDDNYEYQWYKNNIPIQATNSDNLIIVAGFDKTSYHATVKNTTNGCVRNSETIIVQFFKMPENSGLKISPKKQDCYGDSIVTIKEGIYNDNFMYQWYRDGEILPDETQSSISSRFLKDGNYTLSITNKNNEKCAIEKSHTYTSSKFVHFKPKINTYDTEKYYLQCSETKIKEYVWYYNQEIISGANDNEYFAGTNYGTYIVGIKDKQMDCFEFSPALTTPLDKTRVDFSSNDDILMYPNPADGIVTVEVGGEEIIAITLVNEIGEVLYDETAENAQSKISVDMEAFSKGIYYIEIATKQNNYVKTVFKN